MSLRVWLPLNGTLDNQGLSDINLNFSPTYITGGKIGNKCLASQLGWFEIPDMAGKKQMSFAYWVKINTATSTNWLDTFSWYSTDGSNNYRNRQEFYTNSTRTNIWYKASSANSTNSSFVNMIGEWNHYAFTIDYDKGEACFYINGEITGTKRTNIDITSYIKGTGSAFLLRENGLDSHINDFRLYDHVLSPMEVKQISQGLVLHYPLNRGGWGQENLLLNSKLDRSWEYPSTNYKDQYAPITTSVPNGSAYTLSFDAKSTVNGDKIRTHYYSPNTTTTCTSSQGTIKTASDGNMDFTLSTQWKRYWVVYNQNETSAVKHIICPRMISGQGTGVVSVKNVKLEEGSIATPWCPNSSDVLATTMGLNDNIQYDTSGYGNNGTKVGITYSSDTPKYNVSTVFDENADTITVGPCYSVGQTIDTMSCAIWFKTNTLNSTAPNLVSLGENSFFRFRLASATSVWYYITVAGQARGKAFSCKTLTDNIWHHIAIVFNKGYVYSYIDGELVNTENQTSIGTYLTCGLADNYWHLAGFRVSTEPFKGNESDFRLYATALSADDVKSLYNNSAYIDNQGNIYGAVYEEV